MSTSIPPTPVADDLGWTLSVVLRALVKATSAATADLPCGPRGYQVLATVTNEEPGSQSELAHRLGMDRTVLTYLLDDLVRDGLVERRPDPVDRRTRRVVATPHGESVAAELGRRLRHAEEHLLSGLDDPERATLRGLLRRVAGYANDLDPSASACDVIEEITGHHSAL